MSTTECIYTLLVLQILDLQHIWCVQSTNDEIDLFSTLLVSNQVIKCFYSENNFVIFCDHNNTTLGYFIWQKLWRKKKEYKWTEKKVKIFKLTSSTIKKNPLSGPRIDIITHSPGYRSVSTCSRAFSRGILCFVSHFSFSLQWLSLGGAFPNVPWVKYQNGRYKLLITEPRWCRSNSLFN